MPSFHLVQPIRASREIIWKALSESSGLAAWAADVVEGAVQTGARLHLRWPALGAELEVNVTDYEEGQRVAFAWGDHDVSFTVQDGGVSLECSGIGEQDELEGTGSAWTLSLATLAHYCESHQGRSRSVCWLTGVAPTTPEVLHAYLTEPWAHNVWLGTGSGFGVVGSDVSVTLSGDMTLSGRVLAHTQGRDLLVSWTDDDDSVVAFRSIPSPTSDDRMVLIAWSRWSESAPPEGAFGHLQTAHLRLINVLSRAGQA